MRAPLEALFIASLAAMALMPAMSARARSSMLTVQTRARFSMLAISASARFLGPKKRIAPCDNLINERKSNAEAVKRAHVLIAWIVAQTHWTVQETPPIRLIPYEEIQKLYTAEDPTRSNVEALYSEKDHTVYLSDSWHPNTLRNRSILLHELVHHLQYLNHIKVTCGSEYEFQAFKLQAAWLSEQAVDYPLDLMGIDLRYLLILSHCPEF